ncbi:hypothetical protein [Streptomyces sp. NPDC058145]|uniref:hypothetical protein n=1 Tax=Streptomyces sp. NPDC058145 TaxID=3346356 RepID=UPI0036EA198B
MQYGLPSKRTVYAVGGSLQAREVAEVVTGHLTFSHRLDPALPGFLVDGHLARQPW